MFKVYDWLESRGGDLASQTLTFLIIPVLIDGLRLGPNFSPLLFFTIRMDLRFTMYVQYNGWVVFQNPAFRFNFFRKFPFLQTLLNITFDTTASFNHFLCFKRTHVYILYSYVPRWVFNYIIYIYYERYVLFLPWIGGIPCHISTNTYIIFIE